MKTLVYSIHGFDRPVLAAAALDKIDLVYTEKALDETTAHLAKGFDAVALFTSDIANAEVLDILHAVGVSFIALRTVGYNHVDLMKAKELGIKVANVPSYSPHSVAEFTVTLLLAMNRHLLEGQDLMKQNDFRLAKLVGFDLHGKTVGIVGTGKIGSAFATIMQGFGCELVGYDLHENKELMDQTKISYTSLHELCSRSDVISVHCPLNSDTDHLFNKTRFDQMKKGVFFLNTSRGEIVNTEDLMNALDTGIVAAAGLDVYENERSLYFYDHSHAVISDSVFLKLRTYPNVLLTGHQAFLTEEALQGIAEVTISNICAWKIEGTSKNDLC